MGSEQDDIPGSGAAQQLDVGRLEQQVEALIVRVAKLAKENESLRSHQEQLVAERARLLEKTEIARSRVEAMILRLKEMERE